MSLRPQQPIPLVPDDTARVARAAFRTRNPYLILRDRLGVATRDHPCSRARSSVSPAHNR